MPVIEFSNWSLILKAHKATTIPNIVGGAGETA